MFISWYRTQENCQFSVAFSEFMFISKPIGSKLTHLIQCVHHEILDRYERRQTGLEIFSASISRFMDHNFLLVSLLFITCVCTLSCSGIFTTHRNSRSHPLLTDYCIAASSSSFGGGQPPMNNQQGASQDDKGLPRAKIGVPVNLVSKESIKKTIEQTSKWLGASSATKIVEEVTEATITKPFSEVAKKKQREITTKTVTDNVRIHNPLSSLAIQLSENSPFVNGDYDTVLLHVEKSLEVLEDTHFSGVAVEAHKMLETQKIPPKEILIGLYRFAEKYPSSILLQHNLPEYDDVCSTLLILARNQELPEKERSPSPTLVIEKLRNAQEKMRAEQPSSSDNPIQSITLKVLSDHSKQNPPVPKHVRNREARSRANSLILTFQNETSKQEPLPYATIESRSSKSESMSSGLQSSTNSMTSDNVISNSESITSNSGSITSAFLNRFKNRGVKLRSYRTPSYLVNYDTWSLFSSYSFHPNFWKAQLGFTIKIDSNFLKAGDNWVTSKFMALDRTIFQAQYIPPLEVEQTDVNDDSKPDVSLVNSDVQTIHTKSSPNYLDNLVECFVEYDGSIEKSKYPQVVIRPLKHYTLETFIEGFILGTVCTAACCLCLKHFGQSESVENNSD